jgi:hypothetical protein
MTSQRGIALPHDKAPGIGQLGTLPALAAAGVGFDDFALYQALAQTRQIQQPGAQNYLVSWPYNPATIDASLAVGLTNGRLCMVPQLVPAGQAIDGVAFIQQVSGVYTPNQTNGVAAYSFDGTTFTRVAQGTSPTIWQQAVGAHVQAFGAQLPAVSAWRILWAACLYNSSAQTTAPQLGASMAVGGGGMGANSIGLTFYSFQVDYSAAQSAFPASTVAVGNITATDANRQWLAFYRNHA